ncbi:MAG: DUF835 domain-containing protein [Methanomassiliicoccales archaeon]|nr:DUF835 domain-containing protein [Methanomassiliicoccales archaeon]
MTGKEGKLVMIKERVPLRTHEMLRRELKKGRKALYISKHSPRQLEMQFEQVKENMTAKWLMPRPEGDCIPPMNLQRFEESIVEFLNENEDSIVVLNGLDVLYMWNGIRPVIDSLKRARGSMGGAEFFISLDPNEYSPSNVGALERISDEVVCT